MQIKEEELRQLVVDVLQGMSNEPAGSSSKSQTLVSTIQTKGTKLKLEEMGPAKAGQNSDEVVIGVGPAFGNRLSKTMIKQEHADILRELMAGIEEEGLKTRVVKFYDVADVGFMGKRAAQLSGSGIAIGLQSKGTILIHQKDLNPLDNLELFPQAPLIDLETYRAIGKNAARYAKGENPDPVPTKNDQMARPKYQAISAVLYNKEVKCLEPQKRVVELKVEFK
ncbi:propanediol/glycerol family dehydratase medium subunit [Iocasia frigidifontis]|uniref:Propanediol/glycerol family dehydratase medium subunit n=1 Tax=Iocasia fonsfrigidae TaxID=2682810 RepID=A0A8A7KC44_9FIRM|nr:propanediol/glycerol family dehydratase medium subunit [Iocasia fonsfrigidae]QTL98810.1 propanediol/glycerol family dehydratase medium subunit [Iocasia fonsfrigidae]